MRTQPADSFRLAQTGDDCGRNVASSLRDGGLQGAIHYSFDDLREDWSFLADNEFIHGGYRVSLSWSQCFYSLFQVHNETINVWSHLVGAIVFVALMIHMATTWMPTHYSSHARCKNSALLVHGLHTGHMLDVCLFPPHGTTSVACEHKYRPVPTQEWIRLQLGLSYDDGDDEGHASVWSQLLDVTLAELSADVHALQRVTTVDARHKLKELRTKLSTQLTHVQQRLVDAREDADHKVVQVLNGAKRVLHQLSGLVHNTTQHVEISRLSAPLPRWPIYVFLASAFVCLLLSSVFHTFYVVSPNVFRQLAKLDYIGISVLIAGSSVPPMYYGFCNLMMRWGYIIALTSVCAACVVVSLFDKFATPKYRVLRMSLYVGAGLMGGIPMTHMSFRSDMGAEEIGEIFTMICIMGAMYVTGALLYAFRIPERWFPGKFDYLLSSHQIFHVLVFSAAFVHYKGVMSHFHLRSMQRCA